MTEDSAQPIPPDPLLRVPTYLLFELGRLARRASADLFPDEPLRLPHALTLAWLADRGPMSQRELAERLRSDPADLVTVLDLLEQAGYVLRRRDPADRRRHALALTDAGRKALHERRTHAERLNDLLFGPLDPVDRDRLQDLLLRVLAFHDERFRPPAPVPREQAAGDGAPPRTARSPGSTPSGESTAT